MISKRRTATEHAKRPVDLQCNLQTKLNREEMAAAQADRADDTLDQLLFKLGDLFIYLLRELCCSDLHLSLDG